MPQKQCPYHHVFHKRGPCQTILAARSNGGSIRLGGAGATARSNAQQPPPRARGSVSMNRTLQPRRVAAPRPSSSRPTVDNVFNRPVTGVPGLVARYHFRTTERTEMSEYVDCRLDSLKINWLPEGGPNQTGRLFGAVLGSNEIAPTTLAELLQRPDVFSFSMTESKNFVVPIAPFEKSYLASKQLIHPRGGAFIFLWSTAAHSTPATELGRCVIHARTSYATHNPV